MVIICCIPIYDKSITNTLSSCKESLWKFKTLRRKQWCELGMVLNTRGNRCRIRCERSVSGSSFWMKTQLVIIKYVVEPQKYYGLNAETNLNTNLPSKNVHSDCFNISLTLSSLLALGKLHFEQLIAVSCQHPLDTHAVQWDSLNDFQIFNSKVFHPQLHRHIKWIWLERDGWDH